MKSPALAPFVSVFALLCGGSAFAVEEGHGSGASTATVAPASKDAENAMKSFTFDPGLRIDLWAAEPLLANGVCFTEDEKGRWYVAETFRQERGVEDDRNHKDWQDEDIAAQSTDDRLAMMRKHYPDPAKFAAQFTANEDRIRRLEDTTGSGRADRVTIFADGFRDALDGTGAGLIARGGELWYTCIPNLWHFADKDDDGTADVKEKLLSGFGVHVALRGHDMHGLRLGPDGKLYFSIGDRALNVRSRAGQPLTQTESGSILRCNPDGTGLEIFATGVRNPQELAFDEHGNLFTGDNNSDAGDKARFTYLVEGGDCGWRMAFQYLPDRGPWMRERPWDETVAPGVRYIVPCVANIGTGPSGLTYNPGTGLSAKYQRKFFLSDFRGGASASVVHEISVEPKGAFFTARHRDWLKGMLTTDVEFGNDGGLYVLDWVSSWGGSGKGRIYKFTDPQADAALQKEVETLIREGMAKREVAELAKLLGHADMRVRQAAQFELVTRGEAGTLAQAAADVNAANPLSRLHGIWGLGQLAEKDRSALSPLSALVDDANPEVRAQTAKVLGCTTGLTFQEIPRSTPQGPITPKEKEATAKSLVTLLQDKENRVRFFAAISLGRMGRYHVGNEAAVEPLFKVLAENNDADPILRHGAVFGLAGTATAEQLAAKVNDPSPAVRGGAVVALRRMESPLVAAFLPDTDESVVLEAARAIYDVPIDAAFPALAALTVNKRIKDENILIRAINAHYRLGTAEDARELVRFATETDAPEGSRKEALAALAAWADPDPKDRLLNAWRPLPARGADDASAAVGARIGALLDSPGAVQEMAARLAEKFSIASAGEALFHLASNDRADAPARVAAIHALTRLGSDRLAEVARLALKDKDEKVRSEGLQALAGADPAEAVKMIAQLVDTGTPLERRSAVLALAPMKSPAAAEVVGHLIDQLIAGQLAPEIQLDALEAARRLNMPELQAKLARYDEAVSKGDELAKYRVALQGGDEERGRKIFREKAETQCLRCHKNEIGDSLVGPELTHIGATRDRAYLLESIILPNQRIAEGFETAILTLNDGRIVAGRVTGQDATALHLETPDANGKPQAEAFALADVKQRERAPSPMPPMGPFLSLSELRDLIEYLSARK